MIIEHSNPEKPKIMTPGRAVAAAARNFEGNLR
jgi:hypothetical protein